MRQLVKRLLRKAGWQLRRYVPYDFSPEDVALFRRVEPYTMTPPENVFMCARATEYVVRNRIAGDIVECGVWRGGSMMAIALTLLKLGDQSRHLYLFDTFEGMPPATAQDVDHAGRAGASRAAAGRRDGHNWLYASLDEVRRALSSTGYDPARVHFVKGKVEDTVPDAAPEAISLLRLDTDWYESTRHELRHLYPRLVPRGVLIVDDYGQGALLPRPLRPLTTRTAVGSLVIRRYKQPARVRHKPPTMTQQLVLIVVLFLSLALIGRGIRGVSGETA